MAPPIANPNRHTMRGAIRVFLAESLMFPTGLLTAAFLTRHLGPTGYGLFALASIIVGWIEWSVSSLFARATLKFVGEHEEWQPVGATVARLYLLFGLAAGILLAILCIPIAQVMHQPKLAVYLFLFSLDIPVFCLAQAHRNILIGIGAFGQRAVASAGRWIARLVLIVVLVQLGLTVNGAILGSIGASIVELVFARFFVRPGFLGRSTFPARKLFDYALPLFLFALVMRLFDKVDVVTLTAMGGSAEMAGIYGAAQNLALLPGVFAMSFSPLLLTTLSRLMKAGQENVAKKISSDAMRVILLMLPGAGIAAGAARQISVFCFGPMFVDSGPILSMLIFSAVAMAMISVTTAMLTAKAKPMWTFLLAAPMVPLAVVGNWLLIPHFGPRGAAAIQTIIAWAGAIATLVAVYRVWKILPRPATFLRSAALSILAFGAMRMWRVDGIWVLAEAALVSAAICVALFLLGEFSTVEISFARSLLRIPTVRRPVITDIG